MGEARIRENRIRPSSKKKTRGGWRPREVTKAAEAQKEKLSSSSDLRGRATRSSANTAALRLFVFSRVAVTLPSHNVSSNLNSRSR